MPALFKRRTVILPTLWGWLCFLVIMTGLLAISFSQLAFFLAKNAPLETDYLVVEGWLSEQELLSTLRLFRRGQYQYLFTTGGPITNQVSPQFNSYADKAAAFLLKQGMTEDKLTSIPAPASAQNRTFLSAVELRRWFEQHQFMPQNINIVTSGVHSRRTQQLFQLAFYQKSDIGIITLPPVQYSLEHWWQSSDGIKSVLVELIGNLYTFCCFEPGEYGSHQERWGKSPVSSAQP